MPRKINKALLTATLLSSALAAASLAGCNRTKPTEQLLAEAKQYQQKGEVKAALIELKNAVANSPENGEARLALGLTYLDVADYASAEKELRKAMSLGVDAKSALPSLARALEQQGKFKELLESVPPERAAGSAELLALRGNAFLGQGDGAMAGATYNDALKLQPDSGPALLGMARLALSQKDEEGAARHLDQAVAKDPKNAEVWVLKGALLRSRGKMEDALAAFTQAVTVKPNHRTAHLEKALVEINLGKFDLAKADLEAARKLTPNSLQLLYTQSLLDFNKGEYAAALESIQKILKVAPEHMPSVLLAGAIELKLNTLQQAEAHLRQYLKADPGNTYARKLLAQAQLQTAPAEAVATLAPALKESSNDLHLLALAGESSMRNRDFGNAASYFEKASALAPNVAGLHTSLGISRLNKGDSTGALSELELGAALDTKSPKGGMALVQAELAMKHFDKALSAAQKLAKQQPNNAEVQQLLGNVFAATGDLANARASYEKALVLQPTFFPAAAALAQIDLYDKKADAAEGRFMAILQKDPKNINAMTALAELARLRGQPDKITSWLEKASNENPNALAPSIRLASHYLQSKQVPKALTLARKLQTQNSTNPDVIDLLGRVQMASDDSVGAIETYSKLTNVLPKAAAARYRLATAYAGAKRENEAISELKKAAELQPDFLPAQLALAEMAMRKNRQDDAMAIARTLQKQDRNAQAGLLLEANLLQAQKKPDLALSAYEKAQAKHPNTRLALTIHRLQKLTGKDQKADQHLASWLKDHPNDAEALMYAAEQNLTNKQYQLAATQLQAVLKLAPNNPSALNNLAWTYQQLKDPRALETAEQAFKIGGDSANVMDTLGWMLVEQGNSKRGLPILEKASSLAPDAPEIRYHLAVGLYKSGDKQRARQELDKLLAQNRHFAQIDDARALLKTL